MQIIAQLGPQMMRQAGVALLAIALALATRHVEMLVHRVDDLPDAQLPVRLCQAVAAAGPTHAGHQPLAAQPRKQLLEVGQRQALALGDVGQPHRALTRVQREIEHGSDCITSTGGELHRILSLFEVAGNTLAVSNTPLT